VLGEGYSTSSQRRIRGKDYRSSRQIHFQRSVQESQVYRRGWLCIILPIRDLDSFAESNIPTSHDNFETFGSEQSNLVFKSIMDSEKFLISINRSYQKILRPDHFRFDSTDLTGWFSFQDFKDKQTLSPISITREDASRLEETHADRPPFRVHLDNQQQIREYFGVGYRQLLALLAFLLNQTEEQAQVTKLRLFLLSHRGPETIFKLERMRDHSGHSAASIAWSAKIWTHTGFKSQPVRSRFIPLQVLLVISSWRLR